MTFDRPIERFCSCHMDMELLHNFSDSFSYLGLAVKQLWIYWCSNCGRLAKVTEFIPPNPKLALGETVEWIVPTSEGG